MNLTEFLNDDTCQILLAIIVGIVICYFIFGTYGSCSMGCSRRDGFSVGGENCIGSNALGEFSEFTASLTRACNNEEIERDTYGVPRGCTATCQEFFQSDPRITGCLNYMRTHVPADEFTDINALKQTCEQQPNIDIERSECLQISNDCSNGDITSMNIVCSISCSETFHRYKEECQDFINYQTGSVRENEQSYLDRVNISCLQLQHGDAIRNYQENNDSEDQAQIEINNKNILKLYFRHIIENLSTDQSRRYLAYLDGQNTEGGFSDSSTMSVEIGHAIGLNFLNLLNNNRQNYPELNFITSALVEANQTNREYLTETVLGNHFEPFKHMRGKKTINGRPDVTQQQSIVTSDLGTSNKNTIQVYDVNKPDPLIMGLRYISDSDSNNKFYGVTDQTSVVYRIFNRLQNVGETGGPWGTNATELNDLITTLSGRIQGNAYFQDMLGSIFNQQSFRDSGGPQFKYIFNINEARTDSVHTATSPLFYQITIDRSDIDLSQLFNRRSSDITLSEVLLFGSGLSIQSDYDVYNSTIDHENSQTITNVNSYGNAGLQNMFFIQYLILKMLLDPLKFFPETYNPLKDYDSDIGGNIFEDLQDNKNVPCGLSSQDLLSLVFTSRNNLFVSTQDVQNAGYTYDGLSNMLTKSGKDPIPFVSENKFAILPANDFESPYNNRHFVLYVKTIDTDTLPPVDLAPAPGPSPGPTPAPGPSAPRPPAQQTCGLYPERYNRCPDGTSRIANSDDTLITTDFQTDCCERTCYDGPGRRPWSHSGEVGALPFTNQWRNCDDFMLMWRNLADDDTRQTYLQDMQEGGPLYDITNCCDWNAGGRN